MKKLLIISSTLAIGVGIIMIFGGAWAAMFTLQNMAQEKPVMVENTARNMWVTATTLTQPLI